MLAATVLGGALLAQVAHTELSSTPGSAPVLAPAAPVRTAQVEAAELAATPSFRPPLVLPRPGDRALERMERTEAELDGRLAEMVESGEISTGEARELKRAVLISVDDGRALVHRVQSGEIHWISGMVRGIPLRIRHASMVVNTLGLERARAIGERHAADGVDEG
mgnify:CR=1 FL=1